MVTQIMLRTHDPLLGTISEEQVAPVGEERLHGSPRTLDIEL